MLNHDTWWVSMWWLAPNQGVYMMTATVGSERHENTGMKAPATDMLEMLVFIEVGASATPTCMVVVVSPRQL